MKREDKTMDLKGRHFLTLKDFTPEEIIYLLDLPLRSLLNKCHWHILC